MHPSVQSSSSTILASKAQSMQVCIESAVSMPGGSADVAHKDHDDSPRKMVLRSQPVQLSSATLDPPAGNSSRAEGDKRDWHCSRVLNLTATSSSHESGQGERYVGSYCLENSNKAQN